MVVSLTCCSCCLYSSLWLFFMCLSLALALQNVMKHWKHCRFSCWSAKWRIIKKVNQLSFLDWCPVCTKTFHITFFWIISKKNLQGCTDGGGGPFKLTGLRGSAGFSAGTSGGGSGNARPITISSMFKISESIPIEWLVSADAQLYFLIK